MYKQLHVKNFKSHDDTTIQFHPGINVITGASDAGKSTLLKALLWVQTNRPTGMGMVSFWNRRKNRKGEYADPIDPINPTSAEITMDSGEVVSRIRSTDRNGYNVNNEELGAIGTDVPQSVLDSLNMSDLNIAKQFDPPFLIGESAGEVARYLNKLIKIDEIDIVLSKAESRKRAERKLLESANTQLTTADETLKSFAWVKEASSVFSEIEKLEYFLAVSVKTVKELIDISSKLRQYEEVLDNAKVIKKVQKVIDEINTTEKSLNDSLDTCLEFISTATTLDNYDTILSIPTAKANTLITKIKEEGEEIKELEAKVNKLQGIKTTLGKIPQVSMKVLLKAQSMLESIEELATEIQEDTTLYNKFRKNKETVENKNTEIENNIKLIAEIKEELPDTCPLCGNVITKEHTHE